ncbi:hypothetical protein [Mycoplasma todarodis]|uniref:Uncharacterized protein n=1 Tax=Mycoplasma todarodis TaxID=1937191 RepID=A0A4V2NI59_9MOLU|nr:hypothetical protein [Mycoplasma todarodis]TCG11658.1 hypothetical protein C4B25_00925 [Mycoplasma todarodis]
MKSNWYHTRKKISVEPEQFKWISIGIALYIFAMTIVIMATFFSKETFVKIVSEYQHKHKISAFSQAYTIVRLSYIMKYIGSVMIGLILILVAYLGIKKIRYGWVFPLFWIALLIAMIAIQVSFMNDQVWKHIIISLVLIVPIGALISFAMDLRWYRKNLLAKYIERVRAGKERMKHG